MVFSQVAHGISKAANLDVFARIRRALKPGGKLVISEYLVNEDGSGHPFALLFSANLMVHSADGAGYRMDEYREWLEQSGFDDIVRRETVMPATLIYARSTKT